MIIFLGTSAGEQFPGMWCNCANCRRSRELGGRNIRRNSSMFIAPNILIDFPPTIPDQALKAGVDLTDIEHLFVTHDHEDHFMPWYFEWRRFPKDRHLPPRMGEFGPLFSIPKTLHLYGNQSVLDKTMVHIQNNPEEHFMELHLMEPGKAVVIDDNFTVIPVHANHDPRQVCLNYIFIKDGKTILYASDTAWFLPETWDILKQYQFDVVVMEGTFAFNDQYDATQPGHCNFTVNKQALDLFTEQNMLKPNAPFVITHTGPHHAPPHDDIADELKAMGLTLAYDGMKLEF